MKILRCLPSLLASLLLGFATQLPADVLETRDGSRLVGKIVEITDGQVTLETGYAGTLTIARAQVAGFSTDGQVFVRLASGTTMGGVVASDGAGNLRIAGPDGTLVTTSDKVTATWPAGGKDPAVRQMEEKMAAQKRQWKYEAALDLTGKDGNTEQFGLAARFAAVLASPDDALKFYTSYDRSETNGVKSADEIKGGVDYSSFFYRKLGWYARTELENDEFEDIDLRSTTAAGLTYRFVDNPPALTMVGRAGLSYRYESFMSGGQSESPGLDFGALLDWQFAKWGKLRTDLQFTPSFEDFANYLLVHDSGLEFPLGLSQQWKLRLGVNNAYNSEPTGGRDKLDTTYYTRFILQWE